MAWSNKANIEDPTGANARLYPVVTKQAVIDPLGLEVAHFNPRRTIAEYADVALVFHKRPDLAASCGVHPLTSVLWSSLFPSKFCYINGTSTR